MTWQRTVGWALVTAFLVGCGALSALLPLVLS